MTKRSRYRLSGHRNPDLNLGSCTYFMSLGDSLNLSVTQFFRIEQRQEACLLRRTIVKIEWDKMFKSSIALGI